jgi:hypothetical protein
MLGSERSAAMIVDGSTPRYQLPFEQLPRGFVPFPERVVEAVEYLQQKTGVKYTDEQRRQSLELHTLSYFYEDYPVAYRPAEGGIEVLAIGFEEAARFRRRPEAGVKVVQP